MDVDKIKNQNRLFECGSLGTVGYRIYKQDTCRNVFIVECGYIRLVNMYSFKG